MKIYQTKTKCNESNTNRRTNQNVGSMGTGTAYKVRDVLHPIPSTASAGAEPEGRSRIVQMGNLDGFP